MTVSLTRFERRWAHAAFETMYPGRDRGDLPLGIGDMDLDGFLDVTLASVPFEPAIGLRIAIWVIALAPLFVIGKFATMASLGVDERERVITSVLASRSYALRSTVVALKAIGALFYCGDRRVRPFILGTPNAAAHSYDPAPSPLVSLRVRNEPRPTSGACHEPHQRTA